MAIASMLDQGVRQLGANDLDRVVDIDRLHSGRTRRHFFAKRFQAARQRPDDFINIGLTRGGALRGFAFARVLRGEFGREKAVAVLDSIGVEQHSQQRGIGQALMEELVGTAKRRGAHLLQSQADWTNHDLLRFFAAARFDLAPRVALERRVTDPLAEQAEDV